MPHHHKFITLCLTAALVAIFTSLGSSFVYAQGGVPAPILVDYSKTPPRVSFDYPFKGSTVYGTVEVKARGYAPSGRAAEYVQFSVDGSPISGEITNWGDEQSGKYDVSGFRVKWNTTRVKDGQHTITARGHYNGLDATASLDVTVNNAANKPKPVSGSNKVAPVVQSKSRVGTLSVSSEGYLYIAGKGYLGRNNRVIKLYAGTYTVYAVAPSTGKVCWSRRATVSGGKTTTMRISGIYCR